MTVLASLLSACGAGATTVGGSGGGGPGGGTSGSGGGTAGSAGTTAGSGGIDGITDCSTPGQGAVTLSAPSGTFQGSLSVTLSTAVAGAEIRYTTDGKAPTSASTLYSGSPLQLTATTRVRAQAFVGGTASGTEAAAVYVARSFDATHNIPVLILDSYGGGKLPTAEAQRVFVDVAVLAFEPTGGSTSLSARPVTASFAGFHVRGQSSAMGEKIPYRLELRDGTANDRDCPMFGMPQESDWALVPSHPDKTLAHNTFVYSLGREIGLQAPRLKAVEVYVNVEKRPLAAGDYQGVYQLVETIKNQKNRLNLKSLKDTMTTLPEISGGYIFKFEWMAAEAPLLPCPNTATKCWSYMELVDPDPILPVQQSYLIQHLVELNDALHGTSIANETTGYPAFINTSSFVDHVIVNELTRNMDAYVRSQYFYKDRDAKIHAGPLWDFDLIAGTGLNPGDFGATMANTATEGWQYEGNASRMGGGGTSGGMPGTSSGTADWFTVLIADPSFRTKLVARWKALRGGPLSESGIATRIDQATAGLSAAAERNFQRWPILSQVSVPPFSTPTEPTWAGQVTFMKTWLQKRAAWLDTQWK